MTAAAVPQPAPGSLQEVNGLNPPDALHWYTIHGYAARPASPNAKMLTLPKGYSFDKLAVLGEQELASTYQSWQQKPGQRVALILGQASGLVAIDVDDLDQWEKFLSGNGDKIPPTALQATGRDGGGFHLLYSRGDISPDLLRQGRWPDQPGIELKSKGLIIAAPSLYDATGVRYQWQPGPGRPVPISQALAAGFAEGKRQQDAQVRELIQLVKAGDRPKMEASNAADFADVLCMLLGADHFTGIYQRDDRLVTVPRVGERGYVQAPGSDADPRKNSPAQIRVLNQHLLQGFVTSRAWTYKLVPDGKDTVKAVHTLPPLTACSAAIHADPARWEHVPVLTGVIHIPLLRPDGSLLAEPGYDEATGLLYLPLPGQEPVLVPERPSRQDAKAAADRIGTLFSQFGWLSKGDYLNYLAAVLVPPLRLLLPPPWPLWVVNAHDRGSGKTLLTEVPRILHGGVLYAAPGDDSEETRKMITTILDSTTGSVVELDNAEKVFRSRHFAALFTDPSGMWHDRKLGTNISPGLPNDRVWMLNGNNVQLGGDLPRRALWSSIDPGVPEPWLRPAANFAIPDLAGHVRASRPMILSDLLLLGRHWVLAGGPRGSAARGDNFATFAACMPGLLECCGLAGHGEFWATATNKAADGADDEDWAGFLAAVHKQKGSGRWTARELIDQADEGIIGALPGDLANRHHRGDDVAKSLGRWLANHQGRWTSGRHAVRQVGGGEGGHPKVWSVEHRQAV